MANETKDLMLEIQVPGRKYQFQADSVKNLEVWVAEIKRVVAQKDRLKKAQSAPQLSVSTTPKSPPTEPIQVQVVQQVKDQSVASNTPPSPQLETKEIKAEPQLIIPLSTEDDLPPMDDSEIQDIPITKLVFRIEQLSRPYVENRTDISGYLAEYTVRNLPFFFSFQVSKNLWKYEKVCRFKVDIDITGISTT